MVRLIFLIIFISFAVWLLRPLLRTKNRKKNKTSLNEILGSNKNIFMQQNTVLIIITFIIIAALVFWLLSKFGINFLALLQKIIPIISFLRGILPF